MHCISMQYSVMEACRVGDVENDQALNEKISPFYHADKIKAPLLIGQGANDQRVKQAEADQIYNAMKVRQNVSHTWAFAC